MPWSCSIYNKLSISCVTSIKGKVHYLKHRKIIYSTKMLIFIVPHTVNLLNHCIFMYRLNICSIKLMLSAFLHILCVKMSWWNRYILSSQTIMLNRYEESLQAQAQNIAPKQTTSLKRSCQCFCFVDDYFDL